MDEEKVIVKLRREPLPTERAERKAKRRRLLAKLMLSVFLLFIGFVGGLFGKYVLNTINYISESNNKFDEMLDYFNSYYLYKSDYEDLTKTMEDKAFYGMTKFENDPYTTYMSSEELDSFSSGINMNYVGIGVQYKYDDGIAQIERVFRHSPAEDAGMMAGDILKSVDGKSLEGVDSDGIKELVTGKKGTVVKIGVLRAGEEKEFMVVRAKVDSTVYAYAKDDYVVMELMSFGDGTARECMNYLDDYTDYSKLIIDLRNNGGGYQDAVQEVAGLFLGKDKLVMNQTFNNGTTVEFKTIVHAYYPNFKKIVILTNGKTASASEVLTSCLSEMHDDVTIVGEKTYGKGVVQTSVILKDGSALKITSSKWTSPKGVWYEKTGITPDVEVKLADIFYEPVYNMNENDTYKYDCVSLFVRTSQLALKYLGYDCKRTDGYFDHQFESELIKFQRDSGNPATGILDKDTYEAIISTVSYTYGNVPEKDAQMVKAVEIISEQ